MAQQILKEVDGAFKSFFGLLKLIKKGKYSFRNYKLPRYLPKDRFTTLVIGFVRRNGTKLILPYSNSFRKTYKPVEIRIPPILTDKPIKEIRSIPKSGKSNVVGLTALYSSGEVDTPVRIRVT